MSLVSDTFLLGLIAGVAVCFGLLGAGCALMLEDEHRKEEDTNKLAQLKKKEGGIIPPPG